MVSVERAPNGDQNRFYVWRDAQARGYALRRCYHFALIKQLRVTPELNGSVDVASMVRELLVKHYDPVYLQSMKRNFDLYGEALTLRPAGHSEAAMETLAREMVSV